MKGLNEYTVKYSHRRVEISCCQSATSNIEQNHLGQFTDLHIKTVELPKRLPRRFTYYLGFSDSIISYQEITN